MRIIPFKPPHLSQVSPQAVQGTGRHDFDKETADGLALPGLAFSATSEGAIVGCAGIVPLWPGVAHAWAVLSDSALAEPVTLTRAVLRELARIECKCELHRIQATVADGHIAGRQWLAWLGFEAEGLMPNYGPGGCGDYWLYGRAS